MSMIEAIRAQKTEARKVPERAVEVGILNLLIGEVETVQKRTGKEVTDAQVIDGIKKLIKSNNDTLSYGHVPKFVMENEILTKLLPAQLSEEEIRRIIAEQNLQGVPAVMQFLNSNYSGQFDKALASSIARSL